MDDKRVCAVPAALTVTIALMAVVIAAIFALLLCALKEIRAIQVGGDGQVRRYVFRAFHLDNAVLGGADDGVGIRIDGDQKRRLEALRDALVACPPAKGALDVVVRGYASSAPFRNRDAAVVEDSDKRNLEAANRRAEVVARILGDGESNLKVTPKLWKSFEDMRDARPFDDHHAGGERAPELEFLNRSVEVLVPDTGECMVRHGAEEG